MTLENSTCLPDVDSCGSGKRGDEKLIHGFPLALPLGRGDCSESREKGAVFFNCARRILTSVVRFRAWFICAGAKEIAVQLKEEKPNENGGKREEQRGVEGLNNGGASENYSQRISLASTTRCLRTKEERRRRGKSREGEAAVRRPFPPLLFPSSPPRLPRPLLFLFSR